MPAELRRAVPQGYKLLKWSIGDLNGDALPDAALAVERQSDPTQRQLLILIRDKDQRLHARIRNSRAILPNITEDPLESLSILPQQTLEIVYYGGTTRYTRQYRFRYVPDIAEWRLSYIFSEAMNAVTLKSSEKCEQTESTIVPAVFLKDFNSERECVPQKKQNK